MAPKDDGEILREEGNQRIVDLALHAVYMRTGKAKWSFGKGQSWTEKGYQGGKRGKEERTHGRKGRWHGRTQSMLDSW